MMSPGRTQMFPFLMKQHLQDERDDTELAFTTLPLETVLAIQEDPNPPLYACQVGGVLVMTACHGRACVIIQNVTCGDRTQVLHALAVGSLTTGPR